ncbi:MAG: cell envelope integrity protein CreD [Gammaproteobacteria bacterium]|nr:cell envelope integrity protein CreD [Gammaproteobacteria bacterium]
MNQLSIRFLVVGALVLGMLIPLVFVGGVADERQRYYAEAVGAIADSWGGDQTIIGPLLVVPVLSHYTTKSDDGELVQHDRRFQRVVVPETLAVTVSLDHQFRQRAIYEVPVYLANLTVSGRFTGLETAAFMGRYDEVVWEDATLVVGIQSTHAISEASSLKWSTTELPFEAGTGHEWLGSGVHVALPDNLEANAIDFEFTLQLKGTNSFGVAPVGSKSSMKINSTWPHPSFQGQFLPDQREVRDDGFTAVWSIHELARNLPSSWIVGMHDPNLHATRASVVLHNPVSQYHVIERGIKYGVLFIALTYLTFVCFELTTPIRFHYVQYGVVGLGLTLFYMTLLSLSEHMSFVLAYCLATGLLTGLLSWYVHSMAHSKSLTVSISAIVLSLYIVLYTLLKLEAFALLAGTGVLLIGLAALMFATRGLSEHVTDDSPR